MKRSKKIKFTCSEHFRAGAFPKPGLSPGRVYPRIYHLLNVSPVALAQEGRDFTALALLDPTQQLCCKPIAIRTARAKAQTSTPVWLLIAAFHLACRLWTRNAQNFLFHPIRSSVLSLARPQEHNGCSWRRAGPILLPSSSDT